MSAAAPLQGSPQDALVQALGTPGAADAAAAAVLHSLFQRQGDPQGERYAVGQVCAFATRAPFVFNHVYRRF